MVFSFCWFLFVYVLYKNKMLSNTLQFLLISVAALQGLISHSKYENLWCFLFCKEDVALLQGALKKLLTSPVIIFNLIFYLSSTQHCVYHLLRNVVRSLLFRLHMSAGFYNKKRKFFNTVLTLNANFLYYSQCSFNNVIFS